MRVWVTFTKFCFFAHGDVSKYDVITPAVSIVDQFDNIFEKLRQFRSIFNIKYNVPTLHASNEHLKFASLYYIPISNGINLMKHISIDKTKYF